jgi:choline-sulfatase
LSRRFRYTFILCLIAVATALAAMGGWRYARASSPVSGPIILISIDSLRADHLPAYGYRGVRTPALDTLVADGVVFERAFSHSPQTLPAHASLLSGRLPFETGVRDGAGFTVRDSERLVAEILADRGYGTAGIVSSYTLRRETGIAQGFSFFDAARPAASPAALRPGLTRDGAESERIAERWLASARTDRAFLFLHLDEPHAPYAPPPRYDNYSSYDGEIAYVDEIVGRLIRYLKTHQLYDQTTIMVVADHGEGLGDHGETGHGLLLYDEVLRVPLIAKPAAGEGAGRRVPDVVQLVDIVPTILDLAKAPIPDGLRGMSLKPLIGGHGRFPKRIVYSESLFGRYRFGWSELTSVTDGRYRLIRGPREALYALEADPADGRNLAGLSGAEYNALKAALDQTSALAVPTPPAVVPPDDLARLAALGHVGTPRMPDLEVPPAGEVDAAMVEAYRTAMDNAVNRQWPQAIELLQAILREQPDAADLWIQLAEINQSAGRVDRAVEAYGRAAALRPDDPALRLGSALALMRMRRLDEARRQAAVAAELTRDAAVRARASVIPGFIDARLLYEQGRFDEALPLLEAAIAALKKADAAPIPFLQFYLGDSLTHLERPADAEHHLLEELEYFPQNVRARGALAVLYHDAGRAVEADQALTDLLQISPTPDTYDLAARLWTGFGNHGQAAAVRAERARIFATGRRPAGITAQ